MKRAVLIEPDGTVSPVVISVGSTVHTELKQMQGHVGGYLEAIRHDHPNLTAFCDEDGSQKKLQPNRLATAIFGESLLNYSPWPRRAILGNVLVLGRTDEDGETHGLTPEQADIFLSPSGEEIINALASQ